MARSFASASSQYLECGDPVVTGYPLTLACWFNAANVIDAHCLLSVGDDGSEDYFGLFASGNLAGDPVTAAIRSGVTGSNATTSTSYAANAWNHAAGAFASATSRTAYLNGGGAGTATDSLTPSVAGGQTAVGRLTRATPGSYTTGLIAEAAAWSAALTQAEIAALAAGVSPLLVRPASLVAYWPLLGWQNPERDVRGLFPLSVTGTSVADDPPLVRQRRLRDRMFELRKSFGASAAPASRGFNAAIAAQANAIIGGAF